MKKRFFLCGAALLVLFATVSIRESVTATLRDTGRYCYGFGCSRNDVRDALFAAYRYGQGSAAYGVGEVKPARYTRPWGRNAEALADRIVVQPWFPAFGDALRTFAKGGMVGFLDAFNRSVMNGASFLNDETFRELTRSEHIDVETPEGYKRAVSRYFVLLGYDRRLVVSAACFKRLLIGYFTAPAEAGGTVDSIGMDKFTHYYHAREAAGHYGMAGALACGLGVELTEFFMGHHHAQLLLRTFSDWNRFVFRWKGGWPRIYPSRDFYAANTLDFTSGGETYEKWIDTVSSQPFGWGDLAANWEGALSVRFSLLDLATLLVLAVPIGLIFLARRRSGKTAGWFGRFRREPTPARTT